jgi:hypothetical protein
MSKARGLADLGNAYSDGALSNRNLIMNGSFQVAQRGTIFSGFTANSYLIDRWFAGGSPSTLAVSQQSGVNVNGNICKTMRVDATGPTGFDIYQSIEDWQYLSGKTVSMSFWYRTNVSGIILRQYATATHDTLPNTSGAWTYRTATFTLGVLQSGPRQANCATFGFWDNATGNVVSGSYFEITQVQLEVGDTATPFENRSLGQELALCQRYYTRMAGAAAYTRYSSGFNYLSTVNNSVVHLPTSMRALGTFTSSNASTFSVYHSGGSVSICNAISLDASGGSATVINVNATTSGLTIGGAGLLLGSAVSYLALDAEL